MWNRLEILFRTWPPYMQDIALVLLAIFCGLAIKGSLSLYAKWYCKKIEGYSFIRSLVSRLGRPLNFFLPLALINLFLPLMNLSGRPMLFVTKLTGILLIISFAVLLIGIIKVVQDYVIHRYDLTKADNLKERKIRTQLQFFRKLLVALIIMLAIGAILLSFEGLRRIGTGLLTGVGIGGIIVGFAAQKSLGNFLAGLQIAFTQPIRIDDVLVVEGEWGRVEEITLTYVVLNCWDKRRLILPITYFTEKPFQNWTRTTAELLGTVLIYLDYTAPIEELRSEFKRLLEQSDLWDGKVGVVQVTDASENSMQVRFLVSAGSSGKAFDLRCYIREHIIAYVQKHYPDALPKSRAELIDARSPDDRNLPFTSNLKI